MVIATRLKVLDPVEPPAVEGARPAPRLDTLNGKVVGLFNNGKLNAKELLDQVGGLLGERFKIQGVVSGPYPDTGSKISKGYWKGADLVILANGD